MISKRLSEQGFINLHRKPILRLVGIALLAYLFYSPRHWELEAAMLLCAQISGILLLFAGILGRVLATLTIGGHKDRMIVRTELYSICRNPLYFASFLMAIGAGLLSGRMDFLILLSSSFLAVFYPMMRNEARHLKERFEGFTAYEKEVPLFFPDFRLWQARSNFGIDFRLVMKTLMDAGLTLMAIPVMTLFRLFI